MLCSMKKHVPRFVSRAVMGVCPSRRRYIQMAGHGGCGLGISRTPLRHGDFETQEMRASAVRHVMGGQGL